MWALEIGTRFREYALLQHDIDKTTGDIFVAQQPEVISIVDKDLTAVFGNGHQLPLQGMKA